ncbi:MAG TPA: prolipoprotein diacylglyceryl transferase [Opitutaceae bacterium]|nr:prolipoprotein diacylglyceryl transferase [Opitutaceae bacterium]
MLPALPLAHWVHDLDPFLVRFTENFGIRYYGLAYLLGFIAAAWLLHLYHRRNLTPLNLNASLDLMFYLIAGTLIGGRLGSYFLYGGWRSFSDDPLGVFKLWQSGMASHGGFAGVAVAMALFARSRKVPFPHLADLVATAAPVGIFLGRIANFINGELWGRISNVPWAVIFPDSARPGTPPELIAPRHPSQLYEAALEGLLLLAYMQIRLWKSDAVRTRPGRLAGEFLIGYAAVRAIGELFREADAGVSLILGLHRGTFFSIFLVFAGAALIWRARRTARPAVRPTRSAP